MGVAFSKGSEEQNRNYWKLNEYIRRPERILHIVRVFKRANGEERGVWWLCSVSVWLEWITFPRILFYMYIILYIHILFTYHYPKELSI